jgi:hypothetical protein
MRKRKDFGPESIALDLDRLVFLALEEVELGLDLERHERQLGGADAGGEVAERVAARLNAVGRSGRKGGFLAAVDGSQLLWVLRNNDDGNWV